GQGRDPAVTTGGTRAPGSVMLSIVTSPQDLDERFRTALGELTPPAEPREAHAPVRDGSRLTGAQANALFDAQLASRHLDLAARWLRSFGEGYYTIGPAGHEGAAAAALNTAAWGDPPGLRIAVLFACQHNERGRSVRWPEGGVAMVLRAQPGVRSPDADGCDLAASCAGASDAAGWVRQYRRPAV